MYVRFHGVIILVFWCWIFSKICVILESVYKTSFDICLDILGERLIKPDNFICLAHFCLNDVLLGMWFIEMLGPTSLKSVVPWKIDFLFFIRNNMFSILAYFFISKKFLLDRMGPFYVFYFCYVWFLWRHIWETNKWLARRDVETFIISTLSINAPLFTQ